MTTDHEPTYLIKVQRNNIVVHLQEAPTLTEARALQQRFEQVPHTTVDVVKVHDPLTTDLTAHTREIVEDIAAQAHN